MKVEKLQSLYMLNIRIRLDNVQIINVLQSAAQLKVHIIHHEICCMLSALKKLVSCISDVKQNYILYPCQCIVYDN